MSRLNLLSSNSKLAKSEAEFSHVINAGLFLAPHRQSGRNTCPEAGHCAKACVLWFSGRTVFDSVRDAMIRRTNLFFEDRLRFYDSLYDDLAKLKRKAERKSKSVYVRLNGASDLDFAKVADDWPTISFYDYTKVRKRIRRGFSDDWPINYSLTYSLSEKADTDLATEYLEAGHNASAVFDTDYHPQSGRIGRLPEWHLGFRVIDGDKHDIRHTDFDGSGRIVGLRFKGSRKRIDAGIKAGFVIAT